MNPETDVKVCPGGIDSGLLKLSSLRGRMGVKCLHRKKKRRLKNILPENYLARKAEICVKAT